MHRVVATEYRSCITRGSSRPIVVADASCACYVVKLRASGEGHRSLAVEALVTRLAGQLDLPVLPCKEVILGESILDPIHDRELHETVKRSLGSNLGFDYLETVTPYTHESKDAIPKSLRDAIFVFDLVLLNVDRTDRNPNAFFFDGTFYAHDFGACFRLLASNALADATITECLKRLRTHPFYDESMVADTFLDRLVVVDPACIDAMLADIPDAWFEDGGKLSKQGLRETLTAILSNRDWFVAALDSLRDIPYETPSDRVLQVARNKEAFERKTGLIL